MFISSLSVKVQTDLPGSVAKSTFYYTVLSKTQKNFSAQESSSNLVGPIQEALREHYCLQEVHQCLIQYENCQRSTCSIMLENGVNIRNKTLFILQNLFSPDSLRDPQEADNKRILHKEKKNKINLGDYAEKK